MGIHRHLISILLCAGFWVVEARADEPPGLHAALVELERRGQFSGAVVVRGPKGVRFARGYGLADPSTGRRFTPDTPVDGASLAKPLVASAVLLLRRDRKIDLDRPVRTYLPDFPHERTTVRHLLAHSAGLPDYDAFEPVAGKSNLALLRELRVRRTPPAFVPGSGFAYCNICYDTLALLVERVSGTDLATFLHSAILRPVGAHSVVVRPMRLSQWTGRGIGYRRNAHGQAETNDSIEGEAFFGGGNLSFNAADLARWGSAWWTPRLATIRGLATKPARVGSAFSGLTWGNWNCAGGGRRCSYSGHHQGFHHNVYWDRDRRISVAMVTNNTLAPSLQQRLQRALVAFSEGRSEEARRELASLPEDSPVSPGSYVLPGGEIVRLAGTGPRMTVRRKGLDYGAYLIGPGIRYVPGLDVYLSGSTGGRLHWLSLYEDAMATRTSQASR
jgi:CubicO group peptidase (beta-lactamase class C family)